jgi:subtilisin family serine protease
VKRKLFNLVLIFVLVLSTATIAFAKADDGTPDLSSAAMQSANQGQQKSYIVVMAQDPVIAYEGDIAGYAATKPGKGEKINPNSAQVRKYEKFLEKQHKEVLSEANVSPTALVNEYTLALNGFSAILSEAEAKAVGAQSDVLLVLEDQMRYPQTDSAPHFLGLTDPGGAYLKGYDGEGVVVGVIDTGIWPEHPSFVDDGSYSPPPIPPLDETERSACDFGNTAQNPKDAPFTCNNKLVGARQMLDTYRRFQVTRPDEYDSARDDAGHGTHTASTAAGNAGVEASIYGIPRGTISGIAPRAHVIAYKGLGYLGGYTSDLTAAIDQAVADGVDVINYSIGGGAAGPGADEIAFLFAANAGVFAATSAGNAGPGAATMGNPGTMPWLTTVGANTQSRFFQGTVVLGNGTKYYGASITPGSEELPLVDAADYGNELCLPTYLGGSFSGDISGKIVLCKRGVSGRAEKSLAVFMADGAGMVMYNTNDVDNLASDSHWVPSVHIDQTPGLAIKAYIASDPNPTAQILEGAVDKWPYAPSMTIFSSRGPNPVAPDIIKPDITAPGTQILAGYSPTSYDVYDLPGELFAAIQGTSMSSPIIAGVGALLTQAHPDWSPAMIRSAMMTTAYQDVVDNDRMSPADPFDMGAGHVNPGGAWNKGSIEEPGLAYDAGLFEYAAFTCGMEWGVFTPGSCDFLESIGVPSEPYNLNYPSIGIAELPGSQIVIRTVTSVAQESGWREYNVSVDAPPGYSVTVSPSSFRLKKGQSVTYSVTITNVSAPIGEWRFGSLTWFEKSGLYSVKSPIAVKAALFSAPSEISGSGDSGTASFNVSFGYTGLYSAAAHGLVPATVTSDNVVQDPDQNFNPNDGYSNLHQFSLSGAAFFRIAMPPEATEADADLDIFVFNPNGVLAATSTSGGTNELVDILLPMDGTWSVYVHGWSAPGGDSDYDMYTWAISATPGGNMTIDSAPTSATIGATEPINLSWTGATAGQWHLGAVSHTGDVGLMGLTLVNVDNR